jgi:uncharacterized protein (DUF433 family)
VSVDIDWRQHIHSHPGILGGKPIVRGTRISVELILDYLAEGGTVAEIIDGYPGLSENDIRAAIAFSNHLLTKEAESARREAA